MRTAIIAAIIGVAAFAGGYATHQPHTVTVVRTQDDVTSFNDGWTTALSDCHVSK